MSIKWYVVTLVVDIGDSEGLGMVREQELIASVKYFGIEHVETVNHLYECYGRANKENYRIVSLQNGHTI